MLDAYATDGLPITYAHWSRGKRLAHQEHAYRRGARGLAYELVINSDPCIAYLLEENSTAIQALVIAHACYGHNAFFKGNYLFREWTDPAAIVDMQRHARKFVRECEEQHGVAAVEEVIDAAHALIDHGVDLYPAPRRVVDEAERRRSREAFAWAHHDELWRTVPGRARTTPADEPAGTFPVEPAENLLRFIERYAPRMPDWKRELVRIVRTLAQYFYPQGETKLMNEGWATFWHYHILSRLYELGRVDDGFMIEALHTHTQVLAQRGFDEQGYGGINPYALGFAMMNDIRRICERPDDEDRHWFPDIAGGDWRRVLDFAMRNFRDETFVAQYLSPRLMREFRLFAVADHGAEPSFRIEAIHDEAGYRSLRRLLARQYSREYRVPPIQVMRFDRDGDRSLVLRYRRVRNRPVGVETREVMDHVARLWQFPVCLEVTGDGDAVEYSQEVRP